MEFDLIIKDGLVIDGTGSDPYISDVGIAGDRIRAIGKLRESDCRSLVPAKGLAVSPGFIDAHAHSDFTLIADPRADGKILQGVTTEINGNCGMSAAPLFGKALERREDDLIELGIADRWNTVREYRDLIEKCGTAVNFAMLAGHGNIRGAAVGYENCAPSGSEMSAMCSLLDQSINEGAIGLSTGLIYPPGIYSQIDELVLLARVLKGRRAVYTSHMRSEGTMLIESIREVIEIGRSSDIRVHISHLKTAGAGNWHKAEQAISLIEDARNAGMDITCDRYPYTASSTDLDSILPSWAYEGGNENEIMRLASGDSRNKLRSELQSQAGDASYWERIMVSSVVTDKNRWMEGRTITEICRRTGRDEIETVFDLLVEERLRVGAIFLSMNEDNLRKFLALPCCAIGSDSSSRCFDGPTRIGKPHPRTFGTFPKFLGSYVRNEKLFSLPEAVRKMTMLPASVFNLKSRGQIREGMFADLAVFDPEKIIDRATFDNPYQRPEGIAYVLVNGTPVVWEGMPTGRLPGKMLAA